MMDGMDIEENMIIGVVLAAGQASRMGRAKQLLPWGETTMVGQTIKEVVHSQVDDCLVVSGAYRAEVEREAAKWGVAAVYNPDYAAGEMISSLKLAVRVLITRPRPPYGVVIMLADLPMIGSDVINLVVEALRTNPTGLVVPTFGGRRGHPVGIGRPLFEELLALPLAAAPRDLFRSHPDLVTELPVATDAILKDIDTPNQYQAFKPAAKNDGD